MINVERMHPGHSQEVWYPYTWQLNGIPVAPSFIDSNGMGSHECYDEIFLSPTCQPTMSWKMLEMLPVDTTHMVYQYSQNTTISRAKPSRCVCNAHADLHLFINPRARSTESRS